MNFQENIRSLLFWANDRVRGGKIKKHLQDIDYVFNNYHKTEVRHLLNDRLRGILDHAIHTVPFYSSLPKNSTLDDFPVIDKNRIRDALESFVSSKLNREELIPAITSGSTGTPFKVFQHREKKTRNTADTIFFADKGGYKVGNRLYYLKIWSHYNRKTLLSQWFQNIVPVDVLNLQANAGNVLQAINKNTDSISCIGYVSAFETLCRYLDKNQDLRIKPGINSVITMSESLNEYTKTAVLKHFRCPALSRYSNIENGIIAQQTLADHHNFSVNVASYFVEILDLNSSKQVPAGSLGRIVVTDYFNRAMPLIRYDTGDLGVLQEVAIDGKATLVLSRIEGRKLDQIFNTKGELISSYIVYRNMWKYTEISQYQLIQKGRKEYVFKICIDGKFTRENELKSEFMKYLGSDADFSIVYVDEIPLLDSGKRRKVVNEMLQHVS